MPSEKIIISSIKLIYFLILFTVGFSCQQDIPEYKTKNKINPENTLKDPKYEKLKYKKTINPVFPWYKGQKFASHYKKGLKVWTPFPVNGEWNIVNFTQGVVIKNNKGLSLVQSGNMEFSVPSIILLPLLNSKTKLKKGNIVLANLGMTSQWGKILKIYKNKITVGFIWGNEISKKLLQKNDVLLLSKESIGSPVLFKKQKHWYFGKLIYKNSEKAWIIGFSGNMNIIKISKVRYPLISKKLKKGKFYKAPWFDKITEIKILSVLNQGLGYKIQYIGKPLVTSRNPRIISFAKVFSFFE